MLREVVGKKYQSIHQYMIIKADSMETLTAAKIMLQTELDTSGLFIKRCIPLYEDEILDALSASFTSPQYNDAIDVLVRKQAKEKVKQKAGENG